MKKILFSLLVMMLPVVGVFAQMSEGSVKIEITDASSDDEQMAMGLEMLKGTEMTYFFSGSKYVTSMNMMGGMINMTNHIDSETKKMDMLMDAMGNKMWIDTNTDDAKGEGKVTNDDVNIVYDKKDTKVIHGLNAYKFTMDVPAGEMPMNIVGYMTSEISTDGNMIQGMENVKFEGFPLEFTLTNKMMNLTMKATEVNKEVDAGVFELNTTGYKKMTMEEFQSAMGGMGGMGF